MVSSTSKVATDKLLERQTTSAVFDTVAIRSGYSQTQLEPIVGLPLANGTAYGKHRYGKRPMKRERLVNFVRICSKRGWLDTDDLIQLGLADAIDSQWYPVDIFKNRKTAYSRFLKGRDRIRKGLLPLIPGGSLGRVPRKATSDKEGDEIAADYYRRWTESIESLGGRLTRCQCLYQCRCIWPHSCYGQDAREANYEEGFPDDWSSYCPFDVDGGLVEPIAAPRRLPDHHPSQVEKLRLWFGGRDYSAYPPPLCEWFTETSGDDLSEFLEERLRHRQLAEQQAAARPKHDHA
jgi:hypothetical protein